MIAGRREDDPIRTSRFFDESRRFFGARLILPRVVGSWRSAAPSNKVSAPFAAATLRQNADRFFRGGVRPRCSADAESKRLHGSRFTKD